MLHHLKPQPKTTCPTCRQAPRLRGRGQLLDDFRWVDVEAKGKERAVLALQGRS